MPSLFRVEGVLGLVVVVAVPLAVGLRSARMLGGVRVLVHQDPPARVVLSAPLIVVVERPPATVGAALHLKLTSGAAAALLSLGVVGVAMGAAAMVGWGVTVVTVVPVLGAVVRAADCALTGLLLQVRIPVGWTAARA